MSDAEDHPYVPDGVAPLPPRLPDPCVAHAESNIHQEDMLTILQQQDEIKALEAQVHTSRLEMARLRTQLTTACLEAQNAKAADQLQRRQAERDHLRAVAAQHNQVEDLRSEKELVRATVSVPPSAGAITSEIDQRLDRHMKDLLFSAQRTLTGDADYRRVRNALAPLCPEEFLVPAADHPYLSAAVLILCTALAL